jgi:hypothetical protein
MLTRHYQTVLLSLLLIVATSNLALIVDNWRTRVVTNATLTNVVKLLDVPPGQVFDAVEALRNEIRDIRIEQRAVRTELEDRAE